MNNPDLTKARDWAKGEVIPTVSQLDATVRLIHSLPDQWIDAEKVREVIEEARLLIRDGEPEIILNDLASLLPAPSLPTLAEMTPEERAACQWMQAIIEGVDARGAILQIGEEKEQVSNVMPDGMVHYALFGEITPLPDEPKLEWPGQEPVQVTAREFEQMVDDTINEEYGITEQVKPRPEDVPAGEPWIAEFNGHKCVGTRETMDQTGYPWALSRLDGTTIVLAKDGEVTLISRLVPEVES